MNKEQKIAKIYEEIADKTLSFWCKIESEYWIVKRVHNYYEPRLQVEWSDEVLNESDYWIIGHPVMIWDVLYYVQKNLTRAELWYWRINWIEVEIQAFIAKRDCTKPIEEQSEECIDFVFSLL